MKWYLIWYFLVLNSNGEINQTYTNSKVMTSQTECRFEAVQKEFALEEKLGKPHTISAGWRGYSYGEVVGFTVGCKQQPPKRYRGGF